MPALNEFDKQPERPLSAIDDTIWHEKPIVAAALLGYCDGRLGVPANPPCKGKASYMQEYLIGKAIYDKSE